MLLGFLPERGDVDKLLEYIFSLWSGLRFSACLLSVSLSDRFGFIIFNYVSMCRFMHTSVGTL